MFTEMFALLGQISSSSNKTVSQNGMIVAKPTIPNIKPNTTNATITTNYQILIIRHLAAAMIVPV